MSEPLASTSGASHDTPLLLGSLHDLIQSALNTSDQFQTGQTDVAAGDGSSNMTPLTPQRGSQTSQVAPLTPLANLKVLAEASSAMEGREGRGEEAEGGGCARSEVCGLVGDEEGGMAGRKMKSLSLLCKKFLGIVESSVGTGNEFSLDMMALKLGTNRRRIYDIINVLEAVEMIVKQSKNQYSWKGRGELLHTLAKLKAMAADDNDLLQWFTGTNTSSGTGSGGDKENLAPPTVYVARQQGQSSSVMDESSQDSLPEDAVSCDDGPARGGRWDKSLGVLCQKFLMLFLISPKHELTLDKAGSILMPDEDSSVSSSKTKVRRLYDIANVLTTLDLIRKKTFMAPNHRKMPGYVWCGPTMDEIDSVSVCRKVYQPTTTAGNLSKRMRGTSLVRRQSFGSRPFLHQYEVKDSTSAPSTPCKAAPVATRNLGGRVLGNFSRGRGGGGGSIRRSLSFGGQSSAKASAGGCVHGRKVGGAKTGDSHFGGIWTSPVHCSREEFAAEVKEFEKEMKRNSHLFPNVAVVFQDFLQQYHVSQEQPASSSGRSIFQKPPSLSNFSDPLTFSTPRNPTNPPKHRSNTSLPSISSTPMAGSYPEQNKNNVSLATCQQSHSFRQDDDSGLGDSLVGGALMTSLDDITNISQQQHRSDVVEKPKSKHKQPKSVEKQQTQPCASKAVSTGKVMIDDDSRASFSTSGEQEQQHSNPISSRFTTIEDHAFISCIPSSRSVSHPSVPKQDINERLLTNQVTAHSHGNDEFTTGCGSMDSAASLSPEATVSATCIRNQQDSAAHAPQTNPHSTEENRRSTNRTRLHEELEGNASRAAILGFTKGTLQSPQKPAHGLLQSFVRVDDFIAALAAQSREAESLLRDPRLVAKLSGHPAGAASSTQPVSLLSQLLTRQLLPGTTARKPPETASSPPLPSVNGLFSVPLDPKCLVNQKPTTATVETNSTKKPSHGGFKLPPLPLFPQPLSTQIFPLPKSCGSLGFVTPRALITTPSPQFVAPQTLLPNTTPAFAPLTPRTICLPALSGSVPAATPMTRCQATSHPLVDECPPLKRPKLD